MTGKTAVILMNLGGPLKEADIKPFLYNFFMDKNIIPVPKPLRFLIANWIAFSRGRGAAKTSYGEMGGKSPLLENTQAQAAALQAVLCNNTRVFVSMRYWHPRASDVVKQVKEYAPDRIVLLPLYPQFSTTTSFSSIEEWGIEAGNAGLSVPTEKICCYPFAKGFIDASAELVRGALAKAPAGTRVLFSAHGLPEDVIAKGDPYQYQCEKSAEAIAKAANVADWQICYQSRVGPKKWIGPSTEQALEKAAADKVGVVVYPHAFVNEHVETIVEIDMEYRHLATELGVPYFGKVDTVGVHAAFIASLADIVKNGKGERICPASFKRCGCAL